MVLKLTDPGKVVIPRPGWRMITLLILWIIIYGVFMFFLGRSIGPDLEGIYNEGFDDGLIHEFNMKYGLVDYGEEVENNDD